MADWTFDIGPYRVAAERKGHVQVTLDLDDDGLDVECEQGSGYCREHISFHVPLDVLRKLLVGRHFALSTPVQGQEQSKP